MKTFCCCLLLLLLTVGAAAQNRVPAALKYPQHQLAVTLNPLPLLNPDPRLMVGVERRLAPHWSLVAEAGPVVASAYMEGIEKAKGFELRPALRYYYGRGGVGFVQGQLHYRMVAYDMHGWLGMDCVNGVPTYEKLQDFTYRKQQMGAALVTGGTERLGKHWLLDVSVGFGLVYRTQKVAGEENCCYLPNSGTFGDVQQENSLLPIMPVSVKLGYVIK